ncbi:MAG: hypothetical protein HY360_21955 [Verrucomicrobia bacterium]|nr:hypothetical protein [Verrucomicrobiota bacterium]
MSVAPLLAEGVLRLETALYQTEFATRMIFSALVDADRLDTARWPEQVAADEQLTPQKSDGLLSKVLAERERKHRSKPAGEMDAELRCLRNDVFDACLKAAALDPGFFSLTVPTGGGKTLSSMAFELIEAGVDVDFPVVWGAMGPLDFIVQVAGRCNREGRLPVGQLGQVHIFTPADNGLPRGRLYQTATGFTGTILAAVTPHELATNPELFSRYFGMVHALPQPEGVAIQEHRRELLFRTVGREAKVIEDDTRPVIVDYGEAKYLIYEIQNRQRKANQPRFDKHDLRRLQRFMVNVRQNDFKLLCGQKHLQPLLPNLDLHILKSGHYHPDLGLLINQQRPLEDYLQ